MVEDGGGGRGVVGRIGGIFGERKGRYCERVGEGGGRKGEREGGGGGGEGERGKEGELWGREGGFYSGSFSFCELYFFSLFFFFSFSFFFFFDHFPSCDSFFFVFFFDFFSRDCFFPSSVYSPFPFHSSSFSFFSFNRREF